MLGATGCTADWIPNWGFPNPITVQGQWVLVLWKATFLAAICIGGLVIGIVIWAVIFHRKKSEALPRQVRYNIPIEVLYTVLPIIVIAVLFYYTAVVEWREDKLSAHPDMVIGVVGFQWNWQFNYVNQGLQATGRPGEPAKLVLPTNRTIRFVETSPDVIHSFWVPAFLFKRDVIPGRDNQFEITITRTGNYIGRCAELCGVDHDRMDFFVQVLSPGDFSKWLASAKRQAGASTQALGTPSGSSVRSTGPAFADPKSYALPARPAVLGSAS